MAVGTVGEVRNAAKAGQWGDLAPLTPDPSPPFRQAVDLVDFRRT